MGWGLVCSLGDCIEFWVVAVEEAKVIQKWLSEEGHVIHLHEMYTHFVHALFFHGNSVCMMSGSALGCATLTEESPPVWCVAWLTLQICLTWVHCSLVQMRCHSHFSWSPPVSSVCARARLSSHFSCKFNCQEVAKVVV